MVGGRVIGKQGETKKRVVRTVVYTGSNETRNLDFKKMGDDGYGDGQAEGVFLDKLEQ